MSEAGVLTVAAGSDQYGFSGDGGPATAAELNGVSAIAVDGEGRLYIAEGINDRIRMVDEDGVITTIAGTGGKPGFSGDGGPAVKAKLAAPASMAFDDAGNLYFADTGGLRIRKIDTRGTISTLAGTSASGFSPDGTAASAALLGGASDHVPSGLAVDEAGNLVFVDVLNHRLRAINSDGRVRTLAGNGTYTFSGEGGPATKAGLDGPLDVTIGKDGAVYFTTHDHGVGAGQRVLRIDSDGKLTTIAGTGSSGYAGDGGPARKALFDIPAGIAVGPDGNLYVADANNNVIRMIVL